MEDWTTFLAINVFLALLVGIVGNFSTDLVRTVYNKSIFSSKQRRKQALLEEYRSLMEMMHDSSKVSLFYLKQILIFARMILTTVLLCLILVVIDFPTVVYPIVYLIIAVYVIVFYANSLKIFSRINSLNITNSPFKYTTYLTETMREIESLGGERNELIEVHQEVLASEEKELKQWRQVEEIIDFVHSQSDAKNLEEAEEVEPVKVEKKSRKTKAGE